MANIRYWSDWVLGSRKFDGGLGNVSDMEVILGYGQQKAYLFSID